jgi:NADH:ubiquinone oxidoreductase subunit 5 (subunit L)/multisubunit Na+/H+ antiporter MnhA subunit
MIRKDVVIGFLIGILANLVGIGLYIFFFSKEGFVDTLKSASSFNFIGKLVSLGAILNLVAFFILIKLNQDHKARGVLLATLLAAIIIIVNKI